MALRATKALVGRRQACLAYIARYQRQSGGVSPSVREIMRAMGMASLGHTQKLLAELELLGWIERISGKHRCIEVRTRLPYVAYDGSNSTIFIWDDAAKALRPRGG